MGYDPEIHHRRSIRLPGYDYAGTGAYFVTLCVQGRECLFGDIHDHVMVTNGAGRMVEHVWNGLPARFPVTLDEFVVMPNHFHAIIVLTDRRGESRIRPFFNDEGIYQGDQNEGDQNEGDQNEGDHKDRPYGTINDSLGRIIQAFKSLTTNAYIRGVTEHHWPPFPGRLWQRNYYERIIRDNDELTAVREYIAANPANWEHDEENVL